MGYDLTDLQLKAMMDQYDKSGDSQIDFGEVVAHMRISTNPRKSTSGRHPSTHARVHAQ